MATISEDYISDKTAKLLKEKGFDEQCRDFYRQENGNWLHRNTYEYNYFNLQMPRWEDCYACPTLAMAIKWLREACGLIISIEFQAICPTWKWRVYIKASNKKHTDFQHYNKYEEACEAAIKYCLENLI